MQWLRRWISFFKLAQLIGSNKYKSKRSENDNKSIECDRTIDYPDYDTPFLKNYEGVYQIVFIAFHPFCTIEGYHPESCRHGTRVHRASDYSDEERSKLITSLPKIDPNDSPIDFRDTIKKEGKSISWESMMSGIGFSSLEEFYRALLTTILALNNKFSDESGAEKLENYCSKNGIYPPTEGEFQPILESGFGEALKRAGVGEVIVRDEFNLEESIISVSDMIDPDNSVLNILVQKLWPTKFFTVDKSVLFIVDWDSFFTLICAKEEVAKLIKPHELFEGFYADETTDHYWWWSEKEKKEFLKK